MERRELVRLLGRGRVFDLGQPLHAAMPQRHTHPNYVLTPVRRHGDVIRESGLSTANELVVLSGHTGTHLDAFRHASVRGKLHGGRRAAEVESHDGLRALDISSVTPFIARFVLFDVARETGGPPLPPGHAITAQYLSTIAEKLSITPRPGDGALVRTGWGALWGDPRRHGERGGSPDEGRRDAASRKYEGAEGGIAGIDLSAAEWLAERGVAFIGADNLTVEVEPKDARDLPVHSFCLVERGILLLENLNLEAAAAGNAYEGLIVVAPLPLVGATAAPVRPIAFA